MSTRRTFLRTGTAAMGIGASFPLISIPLHALSHPNSEQFPIQDDTIKTLVLRGLDVARHRRVTYADIRFTRTRIRQHRNQWHVYEEDRLHAGVRVLHNGYWGFAASAVWSADEIVRLAREAVWQAENSATGKPRDVQLTPVVPVVDGHWETPVVIDPWTVDLLEIADYFMGVNEAILRELRGLKPLGRLPQLRQETEVTFYLSDQAFGSTDGSYYTQRLHWTEGKSLAEGSGPEDPRGNDGGLLTPTAAGWEHITRQPIVETVVRNAEEMRRLQELPLVPIDVGLYDTVFDASAVGMIVSRTIGAATEVDRMLGYEANATGTSYLSDPGEVLGKYQLGGPQLTIMANRNEPGSVATVKWDSEGIEPRPFPLIEKGVVTGFQANREGAEWIRRSLAGADRPVESNGCAFGYTAQDVPSIHTPNLVMTPGPTETTQADLEAGIDKGISFLTFRPSVDFQCSGVGGAGLAVEIRNGKRVALLSGDVGVLFRTQQFWKNIVALGGMTSQRRIGLGFFLGDWDAQIRKGQPEQLGCHSVTAVPIVAKNIALIDRSRR